MPSPSEVEQAYEVNVLALEALQLRGLSWLRARDRFLGWSDEEIMEELGRAREHCESAGVLAVIAAVEAEVRSDMSTRLVRGKRREPLNRSLRELETKYGDRLPFDQILDKWRSHAEQAVGTIGQVKQLYQRRHWLAHGQHWSDKSGIEPDVADAMARYRAFALALKDVADDYPRS